MLGCAGPGKCELDVRRAVRRCILYPMCGIAGAIIISGEATVTEPFLTRMSDTMRLRGPDGGATWMSPDRRVGLAHRRLSVIDLSEAANQPMQTLDGRLHLVFNGEIYNHAEIRRELNAIGGHTWRTDHADTEVVLNGFKQWGIKVLDRLRGMFAFGLWDARERDLWLVRDHMGIKPLYYSVHDGRLVFASEIKALLTDPGQNRAVNERALMHYLSFIATPAPHTLFEGIRKVPNGCFVRVDAHGSVAAHRWYDLWDNVIPQRDVPEQERRERLLTELRTSVALQKVSDVPVGVFLSGGVDSSTNVALFTEGSSNTVKTFSIGYDTDYPSYQNELHFAQMVAEKFGTEHHEKRLRMTDLIEFLPTMIRLQDEPIADPVCVPLYFVSELAHQNGVVVCQAGEGADELFFGYRNWRTKWQLQRSADHMPRFAGMAALGALRVLGSSRRKSFEALERVVRGQPLFWGTTEAFTHREKMALLSPRLRRSLRDESSWEAIAPLWQRFRERAWEPSWLHWMTYVDLNTRLPELLLMRLDKMMMGVSLEGRVPFLDHKFAEHVLGIPETSKIGGGDLKHLFKGAVRGIVPDEVIDRPKQGFGVPITEWFLGALGDQVRDTLTTFTKETDFLDSKEVARMCEKRDDSRLWYLYNLAAWWNTYIR
jgi:asparagine synthase (glutamine-hydrolysing)